MAPFFWIYKAIEMEGWYWYPYKSYFLNLMSLIMVRLPLQFAQNYFTACSPHTCIRGTWRRWRWWWYKKGVSSSASRLWNLCSHMNGDWSALHTLTLLVRCINGMMAKESDRRISGTLFITSTIFIATCNVLKHYFTTCTPHTCNHVTWWWWRWQWGDLREVFVQVHRACDIYVSICSKTTLLHVHRTLVTMLLGDGDGDLREVFVQVHRACDIYVHIWTVIDLHYTHY